VELQLLGLPIIQPDPSLLISVLIQATQFGKDFQHGCLIKDLIVQSDRLMDFSGHGHEQLLFAVHHNVLAGFSPWGEPLIPHQYSSK